MEPGSSMTYLIDDWATATVGSKELEWDLEGDAVGFSNFSADNLLIGLTVEVLALPALHYITLVNDGLRRFLGIIDRV